MDELGRLLANLIRGALVLGFGLIIIALIVGAANW